MVLNCRHLAGTHTASESCDRKKGSQSYDFTSIMPQLWAAVKRAVGRKHKTSTRSYTKVKNKPKVCSIDDSSPRLSYLPSSCSFLHGCKRHEGWHPSFNVADSFKTKMSDTGACNPEEWTLWTITEILLTHELTSALEQVLLPSTGSLIPHARTFSCFVTPDP